MIDVMKRLVGDAVTVFGEGQFVLGVEYNRGSIGD